MKNFKTIYSVSLVNLFSSLFILPNIVLANSNNESEAWAKIGIFVNLITIAGIVSLILFIFFVFKEFNNKNISSKEQNKNKIIITLVILMILMVLNAIFN
jgi:heme/copper-type cytochrome/quinol oxidase subunit 2